MTKSIDFYFDFISPYSYLAHKKIINLNLRNIFNYKAILLGGLHNLAEVTPPAFNERKMKNMKDDCILISKINKILNNKIKNKRITFLGVTFKANTDDMRDSPSLEMIPALIRNGALVNYYDPTGPKKNFSKFKSVSFSNSLKDAIKFSDLIIIHTEWNDFKSINFKKYSKNKKLIIYDLRNLYSPSKINNMGIKYYGIGR